jgi:pimeloyl-ACP methyl ester carboxylesterase
MERQLVTEKVEVLEIGTDASGRATQHVDVKRALARQISGQKREVKARVAHAPDRTPSACYRPAMSPAHTALDAPPGTLSAGSGDAIVLLHGVLGSPQMWKHVLPPLAATHRAIALAALGHRGGRPRPSHAVGIQDMVDDAERSLDQLGLDRPHLAGNSMGGWIALELCRRGRARSVCALSPAGMWMSDLAFPGRAKLRFTIRTTRLTHKLLPALAHYAWVRRFALRDTAAHGERVAPEALIDAADAVLRCTVGDDLLSTSELCQPLEASCPIDMLWPEYDRIFPIGRFLATGRERVAGARHLMLDGIGHVPMFDDPQRVARAILDTVARAERSALLDGQAAAP